MRTRLALLCAAALRLLRLRAGRILGSIVGAFLMSYLASGCNLTGVPNYVQEILIGVIIVAAVVLDQLRHRRGAARPRIA